MRRINSRILQQSLRYYIMQGKWGVVSKILQHSVCSLPRFDLDRTSSKYSMDRDDLLRSIPDNHIWYYDSPSVRHIEEPIYFDNLPASYRDELGELRREQPFVCEVDHVDVVGPTANPKTSSGKYISDAHGLSRDQLLQSILIEKLSSSFNRSNPSKIIETGVLFENLWANNYFHWVADFLPRFRGVEKYKQERGICPTLIIGSDPPDWKIDYLNLFGYDLDSCYQYDGGPLHVETLVVPYGVRYHLSLLEWVRKHVLNRVPSRPGKFPSNVWISRDDALCRRVLNEERLMDILYDEGFAKVKLKNMSLDSSINIFRHADKIISPHGAGLADLIYSTDVAIVELYGVKAKPSNFHLAEAFGHNYACVRCKTKGEDLVGNTDDLLWALERVKSEKKSL